MLLVKHYLSVGIRQLLKHKLFSAISILGLALGSFTFLFVILLLVEHFDFDEYNSKKDRVFRIESKNENNGVMHATSPPILADAISMSGTGIKKVARFQRGFGNSPGFKILDRQEIPLGGLFADQTVLDVFEFNLEFGNAANALAEPYSVVLTKKASRKLFAEQNPVGQMIDMGPIGLYKVTGVLADNGGKSHVEFEALASMSTVQSLSALHKSMDPPGIYQHPVSEWQSVHSTWTYVLVGDAGAVPQIINSLRALSDREYLTGNEAAPKWSFHLKQLRDITPGRPEPNEIGPVLDWTVVGLTGALALAILLTASFNFANLSIGRAVSRAKEIGIRKVNGATRKQLQFQFVCDAVLVSWLALVLSILMLVTLQPLINTSIFSLPKLDLLTDPLIYLYFFLFATLVGIATGLLPAMILSGLSPVKTLRSLESTRIMPKANLRKVLIALQFIVIFVFISTMKVISDQLDLFHRADRGFQVTNNMVIKLNGQSPEALKAELSKVPSIANVSVASHEPSTFIQYNEFFKGPTSDTWHELNYFSVDPDYRDNLKLTMIAGDFFKTESGNSNRHFAVINEEAAKIFGFADPAAAIGQAIMAKNDSSSLQVVGVVRNYNHNLLTQKVNPVVLRYIPEQFNIIHVAGSTDLATIKPELKTAWEKVVPQGKLEVSSLEGEMERVYDLILGDVIRMLGLCAVFAVGICCLGLLGIVSYNVDIRLKEICIRRIMGASDPRIVHLLSGEFIIIIVVAFVIGMPASYVLNSFWLENLAYHTTIGAGTFIATIVVMLIIFAAVVLSQVGRALSTRPGDALKVE